MSQTRVWAPRAGGVELVSGARRDAMQPEPRGWWTVPAVAPGHDYAFSIDGGEPLPDPRSPWQPSGVNGPSRALDHGDFSWSDQGWRGRELATAVVYELHVGTFTPEGTFEAAIGKLDHLVELGIDTVELMPVAEFPGDRGWGYDCVDLWAPHHAYGGPAGLKRLVDACHARGLAVALDVVYNHVGPEGNHLERFGPYFTRRHRTPWGKAINFDGRSSRPVRDFVVDNALMWMRDYHLDGLRLDAVHAIADSSRRHMSRIWPAACTSSASSSSAGSGWWGRSRPSTPACSTSGSTASGRTPSTTRCTSCSPVSSRATTRPSAAWPTWRRRCWSRGRWACPTPGFSAIRRTTTRSGTGGRGSASRSWSTAAGCAWRQRWCCSLPSCPCCSWARSGALPRPSSSSATTATLTSRGRPAWAASDEFKAFGWRPEQVPDPQAQSTFERSKLDWSEMAREPQRSLFEWYRELIRLRRDLAGAPMEVARQASTLTMRRGGVRVICDFAQGDVRVEKGVTAGSPNA